MATSAPAAAKANAVARPMPREPPVTEGPLPRQRFPTCHLAANFFNTSSLPWEFPLT